MPADVAFTVTHAASDGTITTTTYTGKANEGGWWDGDGESWTFQEDGEYRVDVLACYAGPEGGLWAGRLRFGSAVATPNAPIAAHGRRGSDGVADLSRPWGLERDLVFDEGVTAPHMHFPYFSGDILWGIEDPSVEDPDPRNAGKAVVTFLSVQLLDSEHPLVARAHQQLQRFDFYSWPSLEALVQAGQMPLFTAADKGSGRQGGHPDEIDLWAYMYSSAQRPGVRAREVTNGDDISGSYWRFGDAYHAQSGNGRNGDLPGDFKFLYGAGVIRDAVTGDGVYAIYGSGWVLLPNEDPRGARFMPPFQGAAGGPDGGPLFTVHGRDIDLFFLPLGVRPGAVLRTGDAFRMAGPIMPALPSLVEYTVTAPDGTVRAFDGRANAVGYFYDPADDFVLDQPGFWTVRLAVTHDGLTSAGLLEPPYPSGGPLTPDGETSTFIVADGATIPLRVQTDLEVLTPAEWYEYGSVRSANFWAALPERWSGHTARVVVTMPGNALVDQEVPVVDGLVSWDLDAWALNGLASNFDVEAGIADTITVTIYVQDGDAQAAGTVVTHGARVPLAAR